MVKAKNLSYKYLLLALINVFSIIKLLLFFDNKDYDYQFLSTIALLGVVWLPIIFEKITYFKIPDIIHIEYYIFLIISLLIGAVYGFYNKFFYYDTIIHFTSGIFIATIALSFLVKNENIFTLKFITIISFIFFAASGVAGIWEIIEYIISKIFDLDIQHIVNTGIVNTIKDMIAGTVGALVYINILYLDRRLNDSNHLRYMSKLFNKKKL